MKKSRIHQPAAIEKFSPRTMKQFADGYNGQNEAIVEDVLKGEATGFVILWSQIMAFISRFSFSNMFAKSRASPLGHKNNKRSAVRALGIGT